MKRYIQALPLVLLLSLPIFAMETDTTIATAEEFQNPVAATALTQEQSTAQSPVIDPWGEYRSRAVRGITDTIALYETNAFTLKSARYPQFCDKDGAFVEINSKDISALPKDILKDREIELNKVKTKIKTAHPNAIPPYNVFKAIVWQKNKTNKKWENASPKDSTELSPIFETPDRRDLQGNNPVFASQRATAVLACTTKAAIKLSMDGVKEDIKNLQDDLTTLQKNYAAAGKIQKYKKPVKKSWFR